ncbi:major tail protein [Arthrobacter phage Emotion]|uniref:Major tail protein n=1 Tax=Arthrobacter phage Emotion TaxID=3038361 RepID=A0AA49ERN6_9CAUD|nr:major tail protein [Arthrobacter phage Emotion]
MAGNASNTQLWQGADVFVAPNGTEGPEDLTTAWDVAYKAVGLLDGEEGVTQEREEESSEHYAWGGILYRRTKSQHKRTFKFVALEDNAVTFGLVNPGSTRSATGGVRTAKIKVPTTEKIAVGFEFRDGDTVKRRWAKSAEVTEIGEIKESETDPTVYEITVVVYPEADGTLYHEVETDPEYVAP